MSIVTFTQFQQLWCDNPRQIVALDHGSKTIGVAVSDRDAKLAMPVETVRRSKLQANIKQLAKILKDRGTHYLVIGLPLHMDGSEGPRAQSVRAFAENILENSNLFDQDPIITFQDERLSSHAAEDALINDLNLRRDKRREVIDQVAAVEILKDFINRLG